jgi:uncharacterized damage-inducible protein DinB
MFTIEGISSFHSWTHTSLSRLIDHVSGFSNEEYVRKFEDFGSPNIRDQFVHIFGCEARWLHRVQDLPFSKWSAEEYPSIAEVRELQRRVTAQTRSYLDKLSDAELNCEVELHFPEGHTMKQTPAMVLHHVFTHAFHHKGQIVAMCRMSGHPAPDTDLL